MITDLWETCVNGLVFIFPVTAKVLCVSLSGCTTSHCEGFPVLWADCVCVVDSLLGWESSSLFLGLPRSVAFSREAHGAAKG